MAADVERTFWTVGGFSRGCIVSGDYIAELADVIRKLHGSEASYVETVPVKETHQGKTVLGRRSRSF